MWGSARNFQILVDSFAGPIKGLPIAVLPPHRKAVRINYRSLPTPTNFHGFGVCAEGARGSYLRP